jgi:hypothetical protein
LLSDDIPLLLSDFRETGHHRPITSLPATAGPQDLKGRQMKLTRFTAGLLALSVATAGFSAAPARAGEKEAALALGGLLTLFVIGKALDDKNDSKVTVSSSHSNKRPAPVRHSVQIPNQCVMSAGNGGKHRLVAMENCLKSQKGHKVKTAQLPRACETRVNTRQGKKDAYDVGCLSNFGYSVRR